MATAIRPAFKSKLSVLQLVKTSIGATWALRQMRELVKLGVTVHVALPPGGSLVPAYQAAGVIVHPMQCDFPLRRPWQAPDTLSQLRDLVDQIQPDIIHSHFVGTTLTMRLALGKHHPIPRLFQVPGPLHLEHLPLLQAELALAGRADSWIGSCRWTCDRYRAAGVAPNRVFLSYYGTEMAKFSPQASGKLRQELGFDSQTKLVGMVAYFYAPKRLLGQTRGLKGHEDFIDAIALCLQAQPHLRGIIVGGAWNGAVDYEQQVQAYATQRCGDNIIFLGTRADVPELYPDFDLVVHPSHSENVGGAVESLLLAVPTIATQVGGFPDLVQSGKTGWLVPPKNPPQLATAILEALANPQQAKQRALWGQQLARQWFNVEKNAEEICQIYQQVTSDLSA